MVCFSLLDNIVDRDYSSDVPVSGRWTREEHTRFLEACSLYGKDWKSVAEHVRSRTMIQVSKLTNLDVPGPKLRSEIFCKIKEEEERPLLFFISYE